MNWNSLQNVLKSLGALGPQRIAAMAIAVVTAVGILAAASHFTGKTGFETLYVGLSQQDVSRMGSVLSGAGIAFESESGRNQDRGTTWPSRRSPSSLGTDGPAWKSKFRV